MRSVTVDENLYGIIMIDPRETYSDGTAVTDWTDVDVQTDVRDKYGITAMPTVKFIKGDGSLVHEFVGYGGPDQVFGEIEKARGKR